MTTKYMTLGLLLIPLPAFAQSTTECRRDAAGVVRCQAQPNSHAPIDYLGVMGGREGVANPGGSFLEGYERERRIREADEAEEARRRVQLEYQQELARRRASEARATELRRQVGAYLSERKCADAERVALQAGEIELAASAKRYCEAPD